MVHIVSMVLVITVVNCVTAVHGVVVSLCVMIVVILGHGDTVIHCVIVLRSVSLCCTAVI